MIKTINWSSIRGIYDDVVIHKDNYFLAGFSLSESIDDSESNNILSHIHNDLGEECLFQVSEIVNSEKQTRQFWFSWPFENINNFTLRLNIFNKSIEECMQTYNQFTFHRLNGRELIS